jgi:Cu/Ag efflux protein CusF
MKALGATLLSAAFLLTITGNGLGAEYTKGVVKKIDTRGKKITIIHEELKTLGMPAMTMVFFTADDTMLDAVGEGDTIEFLADRIDGKLTVTEIREQPK